MLGDFFWLYLFIKLTAIQQAIPVGSFLGVSVILLVLYTLIIYPLSNIDKNKEKLIEEGIIKDKDQYGSGEKAWEAGFEQIIGKAYKILVWLFAITFCLGIIKTAIPTTGEAAAIYLGIKAKNSDTAKILSNLPKKYARILELSANKYVCDQAVKTFGKSLPKDLKGMCNVDTKDKDN